MGRAPPFDGSKPGPGKPLGSRNSVPIPRQLKDMRHAYKTDKPGKDFPDDTPGQAGMRQLLRADNAKFQTLLHKMESDHRENLERRKQEDRKKGEEQGKRGVSEDTQALVDVIDGLLSKWEASGEAKG